MRRFIILSLFFCLLAFVPAQALAATDWWSTQGVTKLEGNLPTPPTYAHLNLDPKNIGLTNIILRIYTIPTAALLAAPDRNGKLVNQVAFYIRAMQHFGMAFLTIMFFWAFIKLYSFQIVDNKLSSAIAIFVKYIMYSVMIYLAPLLVLTAITIMYYLYQFTIDVFGNVDPTSNVYTCVTLYLDIINSYLMGMFNPSHAGTNTVNSVTGFAAGLAAAIRNLDPTAGAIVALTATFLPSMIVTLLSSPYLLFVTIVTIALLMITVTLILFALGILFSSLYSMMITLMFLPIFFGLDLGEYNKPLEGATANILTPLFIPILLYIMILFPVKILDVVLNPYVKSLKYISDQISPMEPTILSAGTVGLTMANITYTEMIRIIIPVLVSLAFLFVIISMLKSVPEIAQKTFGSSIAKLSTAGAGVVAGLVGAGVGLAAGGLFRGGGAALGAAVDSKAGPAVMGGLSKSGGSTGSPGQTAGQTEPTLPQGTGNNSGSNNSASKIEPTSSRGEGTTSNDTSLNNTAVENSASKKESETTTPSVDKEKESTTTPATDKKQGKDLTTGQKISQGANKIGGMVQKTSHGMGQATQHTLEGNHDQVANVVSSKYNKLKQAKNQQNKPQQPKEKEDKK